MSFINLLRGCIEDAAYALRQLPRHWAEARFHRFNPPDLGNDGGLPF